MGPETAKDPAGMRTSEATRHGTVALVGRVLLGGIFLLSAFQKVGDWPAAVGQLAFKGINNIPLLLSVATVLELGGSLSVLSGFKTRAGAIALIFFLIPVTLTMHNFWVYAGAERQMQMAHFMKNLSILGGLFLLVALGPGRISVDARERPQSIPTEPV